MVALNLISHLQIPSGNCIQPNNNPLDPHNGPSEDNFHHIELSVPPTTSRNPSPNLHPPNSPLLSDHQDQNLPPPPRPLPQPPMAPSKPLPLPPLPHPCHHRRIHLSLGFLPRATSHPPCNHESEPPNPQGDMSSALLGPCV